MMVRRRIDQGVRFTCPGGVQVDVTVKAKGGQQTELLIVAPTRVGVTRHELLAEVEGERAAAARLTGG